MARILGLKVTRMNMLAVMLLATLSLPAVAAHCAAPVDEALQIDAATLCIHFGDADATPGRTILHDWIARSAHIVAGYYGRFPAPMVELKLRSVDGNGITGGRTTNQAGLKIQVSVGARGDCGNANPRLGLGARDGAFGASRIGLGARLAR